LWRTEAEVNRQGYLKAEAALAAMTAKRDALFEEATKMGRDLAAATDTRGLLAAVARDWLLGTPRTRFEAVELAPGQAHQVDRAVLEDRAMVDGRFEINADGGVYLYSVVTSSGRFADAVNASQQGPAAGEIYSPGPARFGREAGICAHSILAGVTRDSLIRLARDAGRTVREERYSIDQWREDAASGRLREVFACGTAAASAPSLRPGGATHPSAPAPARAYRAHVEQTGCEGNALQALKGHTCMRGTRSEAAQACMHGKA
jgi:hypothetical protein